CERKNPERTPLVEPAERRQCCTESCSPVEAVQLGKQPQQRTADHVAGDYEEEIDTDPRLAEKIRQERIDRGRMRHHHEQDGKRTQTFDLPVLLHRSYVAQTAGSFTAGPVSSAPRPPADISIRRPHC